MDNGELEQTDTVLQCVTVIIILNSVKVRVMAYLNDKMPPVISSATILSVQSTVHWLLW